MFTTSHRTRTPFHASSESETAEETEERLNKLATFQLSMILHAMACKSFNMTFGTHLNESTVPSVKRIVYSTCSIHAIENELVVRDALQSDVARKNGFRLGKRSEVLGTWRRRGLVEHLGEKGE